MYTGHLIDLVCVCSRSSFLLGFYYNFRNITTLALFVIAMFQLLTLMFSLTSCISLARASVILESVICMNVITINLQC
jgi:hypothetical protein